MNEEVKMENLDVIETSGVDHPAHLHEGWLIMKSAEETDVLDVIEEATAEAEEKDAEMEKIEELQKALDEATARIAELEIAAVEAPAVEEIEKSVDSAEEMLKSVPEPVREMIRKAQADADVAREELRKERIEKMDKEYIQKAASLGALTWNAETVGPMLRKLAEVAPELSDELEKTLVSLNEQTETASLFAELGTGARPDGADAYGKVQAMAKSAVAAGEFKTVEQAVAAVIATKPELYNDYLAEKRAQ